MTVEEIDKLFEEAINQRAVHHQLGVTKYVVYNYRNNRGNISLGDKLQVLYTLNYISISENHKKALQSKANPAIEFQRPDGTIVMVGEIDKSSLRKK